MTSTRNGKVGSSDSASLVSNGESGQDGNPCKKPCRALYAVRSKYAAFSAYAINAAFSAFSLNSTLGFFSINALVGVL
eukprot:scaffold650564_cov39-Prasinocladus_malaysianus.AAC.1